MERRGVSGGGEVEAALDDDSLAEEVWRGLSGSPKSLPSKLFYDAAGSELFERITELPEYYLTRAEQQILDHHGAAMAAMAEGEERVPVVLVEPGCGASTKAAAILRHLRAPTFVGLDISPAALAAGEAALRKLVPHGNVMSESGDYTRPGWVPTGLPPGRRVAFFPGSTIGNFEPEAAQRFLGRLGRMVGAGGLVIVGADLWKSPEILRPAYDDDAGVTAAFNRNALVHIARLFRLELDPGQFRHAIRIDTTRHRVEMHLVSVGAQVIRWRGREVRFADGESIHTESCYKWTVDEFTALAARAALRPLRTFTDVRGWFGVHVFAAA